MTVGQRTLQRVLACLAVFICAPCGAARAEGQASATFIAENCAPVAAASDGTMVWYARNAAGVWDAYIGNGKCEGAPLLPAYAGNRGPSDITANGRYVLLTTAEGWERQLPVSAPGDGTDNSIQLYDRQTGRLSTLLPGPTASQRGVIWPTFNANATKIVWSQLVKTAYEDPPNGEWALHVADVNLEAGTLSHNVEWQDPDGQGAFYEAYGWVPGTDSVIFMSGTRASSSGFRGAQLFTLPEDLDPSTAPTRISPEFVPPWPWQWPLDVFHEFAHFAPGNPYTLYTSIAAQTDGGDDLYSYDMRTQEPDGLLGQPTRVSYFGGRLEENGSYSSVPGWPSPSYTVVTTMAWVDGGWVAATCHELCQKVEAWRINLGVEKAPLALTPSLEEPAPADPPAPPSGHPSRAPAPAAHSKRSCDASAARVHGATHGRRRVRAASRSQCGHRHRTPARRRSKRR